MTSAAHRGRNARRGFAIKHLPARGSPELKRLATAYHEAAHAVAKLVLDLPFGPVTIVPDGSILGAVVQPHPRMWIRGTQRTQQALATKLMVSVCAGWQAECRIDPDACEDVGPSDDYETCRTLMFDYSLGPPGGHVRDAPHEEFLSEQKAKAAALVHRHWPKITRVASELILRGSLTEEEVRSLCALRRRTRCRSPSA